MLENKLIEHLAPCCASWQLPLSMVYGGQLIQGIPEEWKPVRTVRKLDCNMTETVILATSPEGLQVRMECRQYHDFAAVEYWAYLTNLADVDSPIVENARLTARIPGADAVLYHGNGDTKDERGYEWYEDAVTDRTMTIEPCGDGTSCNGAFPYMRLRLPGGGVNVAVGWTGTWTADIAQQLDHIGICVGQKRCHMVIHPGETIRLPALTVVAYEGDEDVGRNTWRKWFITHIQPKQNGRMLEPKLCMHYFQAGGKPEFTGATEENQITAINAYIAGGIRPDVWWVDAGWYPCNYVWRETGNWYPNPENFPRGLKPLGDKCHQEGMEFLLWFEPERLWAGTKLEQEYPQWTLAADEQGAEPERRVINLGIPECCDYMIDLIDGYIKEFGIDIYRQDYNVRHARYWTEQETPDRIGAVENLNIQGYYRLWDTLLERNPGLLIDSCASGGRRNDLETMRRSVTLHYTDVGYGNHPIKLKQHRQMFEWIPYFRAHNMNWCKEDGTYDKEGRPADVFSYYVAMAPAMTEMLVYNASEEAYGLSKRMLPIWRKAAQRMIDTDYYPLTACHKSSDEFYAAQFHDPKTQQGLVHMINGATAVQREFTICCRGLQPQLTYVLTSAETGQQWRETGAALMAGVPVTMEKRSGDIWFYERA